MLSLVYRVEAINAVDGTWKYTALLMCSVVENDVAIIVSCTPGFANFTRLYVSKWQIIRSIRSIIRGSHSSKSGITDKTLCNSHGNPNRPRTGRQFKKQTNNGFGELSDTFMLTTASSAGRDEEIGAVAESTAQRHQASVGTVDTSHMQETRQPGVTDATTQNIPTNTFSDPPTMAPVLVYPVWLRLVPSSNQQLLGSYYEPYYVSNPVTSAIVLCPPSRVRSSTSFGFQDS